MVKVRIVCPCGSRGGGGGANNGNRLTGFPAALRRSTSHPNTSAMGGGGAGAGGGAGTDLNRFLTITLFLFVITTYMVLSLDTLMLMDVEVQQDNQLPQRRNLALPQQDLSPVKLVVLEEEESTTTPAPPYATTLAPTGLEDDLFADSLGALNLLGGLDEQQQQEDDESENEENGSGDDDSERVEQEEVDWKRVHTCSKDASQGSQMSTAHWIARHRKSAILSDGYTKTPTESRIKHLKTSLNALNRLGDVKLAQTEAVRADYSLCKMDLEQEGIVVVWLPKVKGDALIFVRFGSDNTLPPPPRALAIEIPHSLFDHTLAQGLHVFVETRARALVLSTSHRCSRSLPNLCTGNENEPIRNICTGSSSSLSSTGGAATTNRNSDTAHAVMTMFHSAHEQLAVDFPALVFASLHSTKADEFVISDGTSFPSGPESAVWRFARRLGRSLPNTVMSVCNEGGEGEAKNVRRVTQEKSFICGATNVQGRHLNGAAPDACRAKIPRSGLGLVSSGRFLHIEQPVHFVLPASSSSTSGSATRPLLTKQLSNALIFALGEEVIISATAAEPVVA